MIYKYYTADLKILDGADLKTPSITIKTWFFISPVTAFRMIKNQLKSDDLSNHKAFNFHRIK